MNYHFGAGPSEIPDEVLSRLQEAGVEFGTSGNSMFNIPHRAEEFESIVGEIPSRLSRLLDIDLSEFAVLCIYGGATGAYKHTLLNLLHVGRPRMRCGFLIGGFWSREFYEDACDLARGGAVECVALATSADKKGHFRTLPRITPELIERMNECDAVVFCSNETVHGMQYHDLSWLPHVSAIKICDMSSDLMTRRIYVDDFDVIFASTGKNLGIAMHAAVVIVRKRLLARRLEECNPYLTIPQNYLQQMKPRSKYMLRNTPCPAGIYSMSLMLDWIAGHGGVDGMQRESCAKSKLLYDALDKSRCFEPLIARPYRSRINATFRLREPHARQHEDFLRFCKVRDIHWVAGYRGVESDFGGPHFRLTMGVGVSEAAVKYFLQTRQEFEHEHLSVAA